MSSPRTGEASSYLEHFPSIMTSPLLPRAVITSKFQLMLGCVLHTHATVARNAGSHARRSSLGGWRNRGALSAKAHPELRICESRTLWERKTGLNVNRCFLRTYTGAAAQRGALEKSFHDGRVVR